MKVKELVNNKNFTLVTADGNLEKEITSTYTCDMLSFVMAHAQENCAWITIQTHINIVAVASLLDMACIIIPENERLEEDTLKKANEESIPIITTAKTAYEVCVFLYKQGA